MLSNKAEDWPSLFEERLNAGDLDGVMKLYEPTAHFVARSGETVVGRDHIRPFVAGMIQSKTKLKSQVVRAINVNDIAVLYTDFQGTMVDPSGQRVDIGHHAIEVLRRQPDGTWKLIVGDPNARA